MRLKPDLKLPGAVAGAAPANMASWPGLSARTKDLGALAWKCHSSDAQKYRVEA